MRVNIEIWGAGGKALRKTILKFRTGLRDGRFAFGTNRHLHNQWVVTE